MATTPNLGWRTPNNDGKVRAGALDIRVLGQDADATVFAIQGTVSSLAGSVIGLDETAGNLAGSVADLAGSLASLPEPVTLGEVIALGG
jgi:hypothetical protein